MKKSQNWSNVKNGVVRRFFPVIKIKKLIEGAGYRQIRCRYRHRHRHRHLQNRHRHRHLRCRLSLTGTGTGTGTYKPAPAPAPKTGTGTGTGTSFWEGADIGTGGIGADIGTGTSGYGHDYLVSITYINQPKSREYHGFYFWG